MINIATDFSDLPYGRMRGDGPASAQVFREDILAPALKTHDKVTVVLDGVFGYASSFLEEAFGGLKRQGFTEFQLMHKLEIVSNDDKHLLKEVADYIKDKGN
ncbi:DUF4325 domain-containing protein [Marinobacter nauticus]|nr:DUF4325 domain-containing protein [Marinobacter nauticus]